MSTTPAVTGPTAGKDTNSGSNSRQYIVYKYSFEDVEAKKDVDI